MAQETRRLLSSLNSHEVQSRPSPDKEVLLSLAQDLPAVWNSPSTDMRLKQRLVRILIEKIVVDVDDESRQVVLVIHWSGGRHSEVRVKKNESGKHRRCTSANEIGVIRQMAGRFSDEQVAATDWGFGQEQATPGTKREFVPPVNIRNFLLLIRAILRRSS